MKLVEGRVTITDVNDFVARLGSIGDEFDCAVQAFDADYVAGRAHLQSAVDHANRSFERGENVAHDRSVEILLYAAGRRQINQALAMGISEGEQRVVVVVDGERERPAADAVSELVTPVETLGTATRDSVFEFFDISEREVATTTADLADLVCERVALLEVEK
ncbi:KEOPS complex component [Haladaptatus sp. R4]|uniref:KEOPS complex subunit Cgi121 n=1 Tax=Haladaptatus sp. R4 TaxID=1679489 RepID=UPI0007B4AA7A|nr:KEOPS complex subunit Cgi121 [Haladaptatus sp. R4]KZN25037.1 KEOPS complex component [Haladaptatus sp. R4]